MNKLHILLIFLLLFNSTFLYANTEEAFSRYYQEDVFYPPEEELAKEGFTLESYIDSLKESVPKNRDSLSSVDNIWGTSPLSGTVHIPVLLVQFSDNMSNTPSSDLSLAFNSDNYLNGSGISVSKYFNKQSYGDFNLVFDIYGWQTLSQPYSFYSQNSYNEFLLTLDSMSAFNSIVDFSDYDSDNDGRLDGVILIYAGRGVSGSGGIWPQARIFNGYTNYSYDGKYMGNVAYVPELGLSSSGPFRISVATHEFSHVLGLPDLYANSTSGQLNPGPMNGMSMMIFDDGVCPQKPINLDVWSRYFFGWIDPITLTVDSPKELSLRSVNDYPDSVILRNNNMGPREFFIIENRYRNHDDPNNLDNCMFLNSVVTYGGFAIYHVDENKIEFDYPINAINWDRDHNYYSDVTWPGITFEENFANTVATNPLIWSTDLYFNETISGCDTFAYFDETPRICSDLGQIFDRTTSTYSGVSNPSIRFEALNSNQYTMTAKMLVGQETELPSVSPAPGFYSEDILVTLSHTDLSAIIYYTLDGSDPTEDSLIYTTPISLLDSGFIHLKAVARVSGKYISDVLEANYSLVNTVSPPYSNTPSGEVYVGQEIILVTDTPNATIKYTLDGSDPTPSSTTYTSPIILNIVGNTTLKARAYYSNWSPSPISTYVYNVLATPENKILSFGFVNDLNILETEIDHDQNLVSIRVSYDSYISNLVPQIEISEGASISPDPSIPQNFYNTDVEYTVTSLFGDSRTYSVTVTRAPAVDPVLISLESGSYVGAQQITMSTNTPGAIIRYTLDGSYPLLSSPAYVGTPITITESCTLKARAYKYIGPTLVSANINNQSTSKNNTSSLRAIPNTIATGVSWLSSFDSVREYEIITARNYVSRRSLRDSSSSGKPSTEKPSSSVSKDTGSTISTSKPSLNRHKD